MCLSIVGFVCYSSYEKRYFYCNSCIFFCNDSTACCSPSCLQKNIFFILMTTGIEFSFKYFAYHFYSYINIILYMSVLRGVSVCVYVCVWFKINLHEGFKQFKAIKDTEVWQTKCVYSITYLLRDCVFVVFSVQTRLKQQDSDWLVTKCWNVVKCNLYGICK